MKLSKNLNFNFIMIYIIHKTLLLLENHLNYLTDSIFERFLRTIIDYLSEKTLISFQNR